MDVAQDIGVGQVGDRGRTRARDELGVELGPQLGGDGEVRSQRDQRDAETDGNRDEEGEAGAQAHGGVSRSTYPTPRTVCTSRDSPASSVLRRR